MVNIIKLKFAVNWSSFWILDTDLFTQPPKVIVGKPFQYSVFTRDWVGGRFLSFEDFSFIFVEEKLLGCAINIGSQNKVLPCGDKKNNRK